MRIYLSGPISGHPFAGDNLIRRSRNGGRDCRECRRKSQRASYQRQRLAVADALEAREAGK